MIKTILKILLERDTVSLGLWIIISLLIFSLVGIMMTPGNPLEIRGEILLPPSPSHLLGTDDLGRDVFSMITRGVLTSLAIGLVAAVATTLISLFIGLIAAVYRGVVDTVIMRIIDFLLATPSIVFAMILVAILKPSIWNIVVVLVITSWPGIARIIRANTLQLLATGYIEAARALGAGTRHIIFRHLIPTSVPVVLATLITSVRAAVLLEAGLSFLGLGDPSTISLGTILFYARRAAALASGAWWTFVPAGLLITIIVLALTMISIGIEQRYLKR